ncbi:formylglycine-generating enzyme family protein [Trinickia dinghuensis]|uniref:Formylglycine-generating enzyme family protein n=1 Tax=Trinickia dinghuensis TaxID=2291023 RepID=A0A3D8JWD0_9BURK|nr:formylglycine-generating enzyme family protein [Trinickia dinghuensis]
MSPAGTHVDPKYEREAVTLCGGPSFVGTHSPIIGNDGEGPARKVKLRPFSLERYAVSGARFREFVRATGYVTEAEKFGWSFVFHLLLENPERYEMPAGTPWWRKVDGACWANPEGPGSTFEERENHPAVHISWADACEYAAWAGGRLPTEAEWEFAARGGLLDPRFPWGDDEPTDELIHCNIWQGIFPHENTAADGYLATAPVNSFNPNGYGLFNMAGNVWEWCADMYRIHSISKSARIRNKRALRENERVIKGGSYLCHKSYCYRYRIAARLGMPSDSAAGHTGFRVAYDY